MPDQLPTADLDWENGEPLSARFGDRYFSRGSGPAESRYVFLQGNGLPERWQTAECFTIGETGFGTGLNLLCTWALWEQSRRPGQSLHFISFEGYPLHRDDLKRAVGQWPELTDPGRRLLAAYPPPTPGVHRCPLDKSTELTLVYGDIRQTVETIQASVDAWYLDGFNPATNPDMWSAQVLAAVARLTTPGGTFGTFTAAGAVRRTLQECGFQVTRRPGFGRKREMLSGVLPSA